MSRSTAPRRALALESWPATDRALWARLVAPEDGLSAGGAFARLRPSTQWSRRFAYGCWLAHLVALRVDFAAEPAPATRVSVERLRSWRRSLEGLAPRTVAGLFIGLHVVLRAADPEADLTPLQAAVRTFQRRAEAAGGLRDGLVPPPARRLAEAGRSLIASAEDATDARTCRLAFRDGAIVLMLAHHPLRLGEIAGLELGRSYRIAPGGHVIDLAPEDRKVRRRLRLAVHRDVAEAVERYLREARPHLPLGRDPACRRLWLSMLRRPWGTSSFGRRLSHVMQRELGTRVTPHMFRHAAATAPAEGARRDPERAARMLDHRDVAVTLRHYDRAGPQDAFAAHAGLLREIGRRGDRR